VLGPFLLFAISQVTQRRLRPAWSAWGLLSGLVAIAGATLCGVAVLVWPAFARVPAIAEIGHWSSRSVDRAVRIPLGVNVVAALFGILILIRLVRVALLQAARIQETRSVLDALSLSSSGEVVEIADPEPYAHAVTGWRPRAQRVVVSSGMVAALGPVGLRPVLAHERSHVRHHHSLFGLARVLAVAINPLLHWSAGDLDFELERWADEDAAAVTGRPEIADALQRAAFARLDYQPQSPKGTIGFSGHGVPARLEALLAEPARARWIGCAGYGAVFIVVAAAVARALERSEDLLEALQHLR
jgi:beta-lactamase regulating signal transducer with metallopeptidase domain